MNYPFRTAILDYIRYGDCIRLLQHGAVDLARTTPSRCSTVLMNSLSTHDVERAVTALAGEPTGRDGRDWQAHNNTRSPRTVRPRQTAAACWRRSLQYTLPGAPCLYYGDEAGLYGYKDPFNRTCYPWGREDPELVASSSSALGAAAGRAARQLAAGGLQRRLLHPPGRRLRPRRRPRQPATSPSTAPDTPAQPVSIPM